MPIYRDLPSYAEYNLPHRRRPSATYQRGGADAKRRVQAFAICHADHRCHTPVCRDQYGPVPISPYPSRVIQTHQSVPVQALVAELADDSVPISF